MRLAPIILLTFFVAAAATSVAESPTDSAKIAAYIKSLPAAKPPAYSETERLALSGNPLGCESHLQVPGGFGGGARGYLWQREGKPQLAEDYAHHLAFYGCNDWHSAVNSSWMMVALIRSDPTIATGPAIRDDFERRFQKPNIDGEIDYFKNLKGTGADFEGPYGRVWLLKLYGEMATWDDPEGKRSAAVLEPLAKWFVQDFTDYLKSLNYPIRIGLHNNTALDMGNALDYISRTHDTALETVIRETAMRLFLNDKQCPVTYEPVFDQFASPCLLEAGLMARVMPPDAYAKWLDDFLPPVYSEDFAQFGKDIDAIHESNRDLTGTEEEGVLNSHMVGLNFNRATEFLWMAKGLPPNDPRIPAYMKLADLNAKQGYDKIGMAGYIGTHWLATYALMYEILRGQR